MMTLLKYLALSILALAASSATVWAAESANGTTVPIVTSITDSVGHVWTLTTDSTRTVKRDGTSTNMTGIQEIWYLNHTVYTFNAQSGWSVFQNLSSPTTAVPIPLAPAMPTTPGLRAAVGPQKGVPCSGVNISAGANIQAFVDANGKGTTFCLATGTYSNQTVTPKDGDIFIGAFDGTNFAVLDGAATATHAFVGTANYVVLRNLKITNYNTPTQDGEVMVLGNYLILQNNLITRSKLGAAMQVTNYALVVSNQFNDNAEEGYTCHGDGILFDNNEIGGNNPTNAYWGGGEQGGGKCVSTKHLTFWYNYSHDNGGAGFWTDWDNIWTLYWYNKSLNDGTGIEHEISYNASIIGNDIENTGGSSVWTACLGWYVTCGCIQIENSGGVSPPSLYAGQIEIANNVLKPGSSGRSISMRNQNRGNGADIELTPLVLKNIWIHDNFIDMSGSGVTGQVGVGNDRADTAVWANSNIKWDHNTYKLNSAAPFMWQNANNNFATWQRYGQDLNSVVLP